MAQVSSEPAIDADFGAVLNERLLRAGSPENASRAEIERLAERSGARYHVDPALIEAIVANESGFDSRAISPAGAQGLMQLMPATANALGIADAYDPAENIRGGARYLRGLLDRFGRVDLAVAAYNAGPNAITRYGGIPPFPETQAYVRAVLAEYQRRMQLGNLPTNGGSQLSGSIDP